MTKLLLAQRCLQRGPAALSAVTSFCSMRTNATTVTHNTNDIITLTGCRRFGAATVSQKQQQQCRGRFPWLSLPLQNSNGPLRRFKSTAATVDDGDDTTIIPFTLADIGEGIKEVELLQWFVQKGDQVQQFDKICEVQSDKATVEITSRYDGIVESLAGGNVGDMIQVGNPLLFIRVEGNGAAASSSDAAAVAMPPEKSEVATPTAAPSPPPPQILHSQHSSDNQLHIPRVASQFHLDSDEGKEDGFGRASSSGAAASGSGKYLATPAVRKLGMEYNLDLSTIVGSGPQGRVLKNDVLTFLRESGRLNTEPEQLQDNSMASSPSGVAEKNIPAASAHRHEDEVVTLKGFNRLMIQTMTASLAIPHMGYTDEFDLTKLVNYRQDMSPKLSILAFFIKATSLALKAHPMINASWKDVEKGEVTVWASHNIGVAMDTPRGLVVPIIRNCQDKSLVEIQDDLNDLKAIGAAGKLTGEHLTGATFSLSNIGSLGGGTYMNPLIVPPQAGIGAMGTMQTLPRFDDEGNVTAAKIMPISWAGDHRMIDGGTLARFSNQCKQYLEDPVQMLVAMK